MQIKKIFKFNGGVHPDGNKAESTHLPIARLPIPKKLVLPLRQHVGNIAKLKVKIGDHVLKGQMIAEADGNISASIHAPTSGKIIKISEEVVPHPSGLPDFCLTLEPDFKDQWIEKKSIQWKKLDSATLIQTLTHSGIVGLGGAVFPTHMKLKINKTQSINTLVINAAECEPFITCDDMLIRERADEIIQGALITQSILNAKHCMIGIEDNKIEAFQSLTKAAKKTSIEIKVVPTIYPSGDAKRLIYLLMGIEVPKEKRSIDLGIQVFNVATVAAIYRYIELGEPSINRIVTVTGNVKTPQNYEVLFGTPLPELIKNADGKETKIDKFIMGGPMMGFDLPSINVPVTKAMNCVIGSSPELFLPPKPVMPCIRCARCADACPVYLQPQELYWFSKSSQLEKAIDYNLFDCIECGCCTYVCPSNIPLVQFYRYAKSEIIAEEKAKEAANTARERNEFRLSRIEREKKERAERNAQKALGAQEKQATDEKKLAISDAIKRVKKNQQENIKNKNE
ncbi:MAG: electron transport complex subunit RsxC [Candidatus Methylopumilus sp.]|nr:electron transport complex subunit RsxC [Candidatus Methylopumilus sp.]